MKPRRFIARRGQRLEPGQKLVGRNTRWGNPFPVTGKVNLEKPPRLVQRYAEKWAVSVSSLICPTDEEAIGRYREALLGERLDYTVEDVRRNLRGYDLGCPCAAEACHADVLIEIANS